MNQPAPDQPRPQSLEELTVDITVTLTRLASLVPLIKEMPDTHRSGLEYLPPPTRQAMGRQHAQERIEQRIAQAAGLPVGRGASKAPGNAAAWSLLVTVETTIRRLIRFTLRRTPQIRVAAGREGEVLVDVVWRFSSIARQITERRTAAAVLRDLENLEETVRRTLFGEDRVDLGQCPHCRRPTLVAYLQTGIIQCERPRDPDGHTPRCECDTQAPASQLAGASGLCPCHSDPRFDHYWLRDRQRTHQKSWHALQDAIAHPTMAKPPGAASTTRPAH